MKAVNQSIGVYKCALYKCINSCLFRNMIPECLLLSLKGRAIRHRGDYSSIVLCDRRYSRPTTLTKLPAWIRDRTSTHTSFGPAFAALRKVRRSNYNCRTITQSKQYTMTKTLSCIFPQFFLEKKQKQL